MAAEDLKELEGAKKPSKLALLVPLVFALINLGVSGGGVYLVYSSTIGYETKKIREADLRDELDAEPLATVPIIYTMDPFVVNLEGSSKRSIRLEVNVELLDEGGFQEVVTLGPEARDSIIKLLGETEYEEIESIQGKLFLKDQIQVALNDILETGVVKDIYFSDFLIQ